MSTWKELLIQVVFLLKMRIVFRFAGQEIVILGNFVSLFFLLWFLFLPIISCTIIYCIYISIPITLSWNKIEKSSVAPLLWMHPYTTQLINQHAQTQKPKWPFEFAKSVYKPHTRTLRMWFGVLYNPVFCFSEILHTDNWLIYGGWWLLNFFKIFVLMVPMLNLIPCIQTYKQVPHWATDLLGWFWEGVVCTLAL